MAAINLPKTANLLFTTLTNWGWENNSYGTERRKTSMGTSSIYGPSSCHESTRLFLLFTHILKRERYTVNTFSLLSFIDANWDGKKHQWLDIPFCLIQHFQTISMVGVQVILHSTAMNKKMKTWITWTWKRGTFFAGSSSPNCGDTVAEPMDPPGAKMKGL